MEVIREPEMAQSEQVNVQAQRPGRNHPCHQGRWITQEDWNALQSEAAAMREVVQQVSDEVWHSSEGLHENISYLFDKALSGDAGEALLARLERTEKALRQARKLLPGGDAETVLPVREIATLIDAALAEEAEADRNYYQQEEQVQMQAKLSWQERAEKAEAELARVLAQAAAMREALQVADECAYIGRIHDAIVQALSGDAGEALLARLEKLEEQVAGMKAICWSVANSLETAEGLTPHPVIRESIGHLKAMVYGGEIGKGWHSPEEWAEFIAKKEMDLEVVPYLKARLKEVANALRFYAEEANYEVEDAYDSSQVDIDRGARARAVLAEEDE